MTTTRSSGLLLVLALLCTTGCVPGPPTAATAGPAPTVDTADRSAIRAMVRVRTLGCQALSVGSGFAVDDHTIVTNRHVVAGATRLDVDSWDGRALDVVDTRVSTSHDLAVITVGDRLGHVLDLATGSVAPGDPVQAVGYPFGHALRVTGGTVEAVHGADGATPGAIEFAAGVHHGNSGGPLLDQNGQAVGVVYRRVVGDREAGLALPSSIVDTNIGQGTLIENPDCERARELFGDR